MLRIGGTVTSEILTSRGLGQIQRIANRVTMVEHRTVNLKRRFENNELTRPGGPLGFTPRTKRYQIRKAKSKGHQRPNVFTGDMRAAVLGSARVTATQKNARVVARGTGSSRLWNDRREEIEAVAPVEESRLQETWLETITQLASQRQYMKKSRVKIG